MYWEEGTSGAWRSAGSAQKAHPDILAALRQYRIAEGYGMKLIERARVYRLPFYQFYDLYELAWKSDYQAGLFENPATSPHYGDLRDPGRQGDWRSYVLLRRLDPGEPDTVPSTLTPIWLTGDSEEIETANAAKLGDVRNLDFGEHGTSGFFENISEYLRFFAAFRNDRSGHGTFQLFENRAALERYLGEPESGTKRQRLADLRPFHAGRYNAADGGGGESEMPHGLELGRGGSGTIFWAAGPPFPGRESKGIAVRNGCALADRLSVHGGGISRAILAVRVDPGDRSSFGQVRMLFDDPVPPYLFLPRIRFGFDDSARIPFIDFGQASLSETAFEDLKDKTVQRRILGNDITVVRKPEDLVGFFQHQIEKKRSEAQKAEPGPAEKFVFKNLVVTCPIDLGALFQPPDEDLKEPFGPGAQSGPGQSAPAQSDVLREILQHHVEFANCLFIDEFTINFQKFERAATFRNCVFLDTFSACFVNVGENFSLDRCTFARSAHCDGLHTQGNFETAHGRFVGRKPLLRLRNAEVRGDLSLRHTEMPRYGLLDAGSARVRGRLQICGLRIGCGPADEASPHDAADTARNGREAENSPLPNDSLSLSVGKGITEPGDDDSYLDEQERRKGRYVPIFGIDFTSSTIEGGVDLGTSYPVSEPARGQEIAGRRNGEPAIEMAWRYLLQSNQDGQEILEQAFLENGWINAATRIERYLRTATEDGNSGTGGKGAAPDEPTRLVRNIIYGDVVFRSAEIRGGANFSGIRIGRIGTEALGDLNLGHTIVWGDLTVGTLALIRSGAPEELLPNATHEKLFPSGAAKEAIHLAVSPTDIDGFVAGRFLTVHGDFKLHGPRADRLLDETWALAGGETDTLICSIDLDHHSSTYLYYLLHGSESCEPGKFLCRKCPEAGRRAVSCLDLVLEITPGRELFSPPFSFSRVGLGLDFRNANVRGHLDLTNVRTNVRHAGGARLNQRLRRRLEETYEREEIEDFCRSETGRCEIRLADVTIGGDLRVLSDRKDAVYGKDLQGGTELNGPSDREPAMWLRTVCARLDMESATIDGDAQLSGLEIYCGSERRRSGSLYAADATISGRLILERRESYYGRPKRTRIAQELGLPGLKAGEVALSALVFTDERSGRGISFEGARIGRLLIFQPTPLFANLNHIQVTHWELPAPPPGAHLPWRLGRPGGAFLHFTGSVVSFWLWAIWVFTLAYLGCSMLTSGPPPEQSPVAFPWLLEAILILLVLQFLFNMNASYQRSFRSRAGRSPLGFIGDLINLIGFPLLAGFGIYCFTQQIMEPSLSRPAAGIFILLAVTGLQLFPRTPFHLLDRLQSIFTGRRWMNACLKMEDWRRDSLKPPEERTHPRLLRLFAQGILSLYPRVFHSHDWVSASPYLALLTKSQPFQADAYLRLFQTQQDEGRETEANRIFRAMKERDRRESAPIYRDFVGVIWRFVAERLIIGPLLGYGTRHWPLILVWLTVASAGFFILAQPGNLVSCEDDPDNRALECPGIQADAGGTARAVQEITQTPAEGTAVGNLHGKSEKAAQTPSGVLSAQDAIRQTGTDEPNTDGVPELAQTAARSAVSGLYELQLKARPPEDRSPRYMEALWVTLRYTIPIIQFGPRPRHAPAEKPLDIMLCPGFTNDRNPNTDFQTDYAKCMFGNLGAAFNQTVKRLTPVRIRPPIVEGSSVDDGGAGKYHYVFYLRPFRLHKSDDENVKVTECPPANISLPSCPDGAANNGKGTPEKPGPEKQTVWWTGEVMDAAQIISLINWILWPLFIAQLTGLIKWQARSVSGSRGD